MQSGDSALFAKNKQEEWELCERLANIPFPDFDDDIDNFSCEGLVSASWNEVGC